jgi:hypothetical protein
MFDCRYYCSKRKNRSPMDRYYRWSAWSIVSIDSIVIDQSIHRRLYPAMNIPNSWCCSLLRPICTLIGFFVVFWPAYLVPWFVHEIRWNI